MLHLSILHIHPNIVTQKKSYSESIKSLHLHEPLKLNCIRSYTFYPIKNFTRNENTRHFQFDN